MKTAIQTVLRSLIQMDPEIQPREKIDLEVVRQYREEMEAGDEFPPPILFYDGERYWPGDGFHRILAQEGKEHIEADVRPGTRKDARLFACGANATHGLRRTNADKRRAVKMALEEMGEESDRAIAKHCGVSQPFIGMVRGNGDPTRRNRNGKVITVITEESTNDTQDENGQVVNFTTPEVVSNPAPQTPPAKPGDAADNGPIICDRCFRIGKAAPDCQKCARLRQEANGAAKEERRPPVGAALFDWATFYSQFGQIARAPDKIAAAYNAEKQSQEYKQCQQHLESFLKVFKGWQKRLTKGGEK